MNSKILISKLVQLDKLIQVRLVTYIRLDKLDLYNLVRLVRLSCIILGEMSLVHSGKVRLVKLDLYRLVWLS